MNKYNILAIFSNHTYDKIKYNISFNNISYIIPHVNDIIIVDSINEEYAIKLKKDLSGVSKIKNFYFVKNDKIFLDFYKWMYILNMNNTLIDKYDYVLFINDSIIITHDMNGYFDYLNNSTKKINVYGFNDSTQLQYHYQSYLYMINKDTIPKFKNLYEERKPNIHDVNSLIRNLELNFYSIDESHDCYIKIGKEENKYCNIFWENDKLYEKLLSNNILCLIKLKRILDYQKTYIYDYITNIPSTFNHSFYKKTYNDLRLLSNKELENHYLKFGQFEGRKYNYNSINKILPNFYRVCLKKINMLNFFDIEDEFDIYFLKNKNIEYKNKKNKNIVLSIVENQDLNKNNILFYLNIITKLQYFNNFDINNVINNFDYNNFIDKNNNLKEFGIIGILNFYIKNNEIKVYNNNPVVAVNKNNEIKVDNNNPVVAVNKNNEIKVDNNNPVIAVNKNVENNPVIDVNKNVEIAVVDNNNSNISIHNNNVQLLIDNNYEKSKDIIICNEENNKNIINLNNNISNKFSFNINIYIHLFDNLLNNEITNYFVDIIENNKKIDLPNDFDINTYKKINTDLNNLKDDELIEHFKKNFINECRLYRLPDDFCPIVYKTLYNDILSLRNEEAINHFINYGFKEGRLYKIPDNFNIDTYKKIYFKNNNIDDQTVMHIFINSKNRNYNKLNII
jgi:hypothetical protein